MKIIADKNIPFLKGRIKDAQLIQLPSSEINREVVKDADALIVRTRTHCDASLLRESGVKLIATATIGTDHIDLLWCAENGISVRNAPGCNAPGVALYVWNALLRNGFDPEKSVLGIVGCGNVGSIVSQWGARLGTKVLVCDPPRRDRGESDHEYVGLEELLANSDAVTLHTPLTREGKYATYHLINDKTIRALRSNSILINASRGEVADTNALIKSIEDGIIRTGIIDTWENEPYIDTRLLTIASTATCHIAGYSVEGKQRASRMALEAVSAELGLEVDLRGLQGPYREPEQLTPSRILSAYDPTGMTSALKKNSADFESLRNSYPLHSELL